MKLQFDKDLEYQKQAVAAVVELFKGQTPMQSNFTVTGWTRKILPYFMPRISSSLKMSLALKRCGLYSKTTALQTTQPKPMLRKF